MQTATPTLTNKHLALLAKDGISAEIALQAGTYSVAPGDEMPEGFDFLEPQSGIMFVWASEGYEPIYQFRPDAPGNGPKYVQQKGSGSACGVHPSRQHLVGVATKAAIVEGTKQALAAAQWLPSDVLVVGMVGVRGWQERGVDGLSRHMRELLDGVKEIVIIVDGDLETNRAVYDAALLLGTNLRKMGMRVKHFLPALADGAGSKTGFDDAIASRSTDQERFEYAANIHAEAKALRTLVPSAPPKPKVVTASDAMARKVPTTFWEDGEIRYPDRIDDVTKQPVPGERLADWAARIDRVLVQEDDMNRDARSNTLFDLRFRMRDGSEYTLKRVSPTEFRDFSALLDNLPGGVGSMVDWARDDRGINQKLERAVRGYEPDNPADAPRKVTVRPRAGMQEWHGEAVYLHHEVAYSEAGPMPGLEGDVSDSGISHMVNMGRPPRDRQDTAQVVRQWLSWREHVVDRTAVWALTGALGWAPTGAPAKSILALLGDPGSGKSSQLYWAQACYGIEWESPMWTFQGTENAVGSGTGRSFNHCLVVVDDMMDGGDFVQRGVNHKALETLVRKSSSTGASGRRRQQWSAKSGVTNASADLEQMLLVVGSERAAFPSAASRYSMVERMLTIDVERDSSLRPGGEAALKSMAADGVPSQAYSAYLEWLVGQVNDGGGVRAYSRRLVALADAKAAKVEEELKANGQHVRTPRARRVPAPFIIGAGLVLAFAAEVGAITEAERAKMMIEAERSIMGAAKSHWESKLAPFSSGSESTIDSLRSGLASGQMALSNDVEDKFRGAVVGTRTVCSLKTPDGVVEGEFVILNPAAVGQAVNQPADRVAAALRPVAIRNSQGRTSWERRAGHGTIRNAVIIPLSILEGTDA